MARKDSWTKGLAVAGLGLGLTIALGYGQYSESAGGEQAGTAASPSPGTTASPGSTPTSTTTPEADNTIAAILQSDPRLSTLAQAVTAAGLMDELAGAGPFTVFAPSNDAFAKLPPGTLDQALANPSNLQSLLLYHVVQGQYTAADLVNQGDPLPTLSGMGITFSSPSTGAVRINSSSNVVQADIPASNGVIHIIDTVLDPNMGAPGATPSPTSTEATGGTE